MLEEYVFPQLNEIEMDKDSIYFNKMENHHTTNCVTDTKLE